MWLCCSVYIISIMLFMFTNILSIYIQDVFEEEEDLLNLHMSIIQVLNI